MVISQIWVGLISSYVTIVFKINRALKQHSPQCDFKLKSPGTLPESRRYHWLNMPWNRQLWPLTCSESLAVVLSWRRGRQLKSIKKILKKIKFVIMVDAVVMVFFVRCVQILPLFWAIFMLCGLSGFWDYFCLNPWWFGLCSIKLGRQILKDIHCRRWFLNISLWDGLYPHLITAPKFIILLVFHFSD